LRCRADCLGYGDLGGDAVQTAHGGRLQHGAADLQDPQTSGQGWPCGAAEPAGRTRSRSRVSTGRCYARGYGPGIAGASGTHARAGADRGSLPGAAPDVAPRRRSHCSGGDPRTAATQGPASMTQMLMDWTLPEGDELIAGVDEVGRGPLCGAVVTAAVILDPLRPIEGLNDSKKLNEARREELFPLIQERALAWFIARAEVEEIDQLNILHATMLAMQRAVLGLSIRPDRVLVDGNRCPVLPMPSEPVIQGDGRVPAIAA